MSRKTKNLISIGAVLLILVGIYAVKFIFDLNPRLGLDLKGGVSLVYEAKGKSIDTDVLDKTVEKIRERVDKLGVAEPEITVLGTRNVEVQLPGISDPERAKELVGKTAQLQFRIVQDSKDAKEVKDDPAWKVTEGDENLKPENDVILPLKEGKTTLLLKLGPTQLTGDAVKKAQVAYDESNAARITFELTGEGKGQFAKITQENQNKQLAIVLDYEVESAPNIKEPITDGKGEITGDFTDKEAKDLEIVLNTGALPVELVPLTEQEVTATLGRDSLSQGLLAGMVGLIVVALFMILFYRTLGIVTCLGLAVFGAYIYGLICVLGDFWSLTLAGIAGIIVSIGIAADSSIVYFERIKEEIKEGRSLRSTADSAYKSAFRTILAADTVSFAAAAILYIFAIGSVKGFALTLGIATIFDVYISYFFVRPFTSLLSNWEWVGRPWALGVRMPAARASGGGSK
jgi:protein-export membrane protein SecD